MRKELLLLTSTILFLLVVAEIGTRIFYTGEKKPEINAENQRVGDALEQPDPLLGWRLRANARVTHRLPFRSVSYSINESGFRDSGRHLKPASNGNLKIIAIGDSFTFGHGVKESDRYSNILNSMLKNTEVMNMGASGYSTAQQYLLLKQEGVKLKPDLVILGYYITNIRRNLEYDPYPRFKIENGELELKNFPVSSKASQRRVGDVYKKNNEYSTQRISVFFQFLQNKFIKLKKRLDPLPQYNDGHEGIILLEKLLMETNNIVKDIGGKLLIVIIPHHSYYIGRLSSFVTRRPFDVLEEFGRKNGIPFLNLLPIFEKYSKNSDGRNLILKGDAHWNKEGNLLAAMSIYDYITANKLIDGRYAK